MNNVEKIRQEIEKRIENYWSDGDVDSVVVSGELEELIDFIDSLPEDASCVYYTNKLNPTPSVNIEDVARVQFASHAHVFDRKRKAVFDWEQFKEVASIFYGFGKKNSLLEEKPSEDLKKAAEEYAYRGITDEMKPYVKPVGDEIIKNFIAGAEWRANQLLKGSPLPEDTILFQKGVEEGRRLERDDFALTWQDMAKIDAIILNVNNEFAVDYTKEIDRQKFYEEVLKRFKEV